MAVWRRPGPLWQSGPGVPSGVMVCLRVLARTEGWVAGVRTLAFLPPQVLLPCRHCALRAGEARATCSSGCAPKSVGVRKSSSCLARRLATAGLQLAAVMMMRIRIIQRCTRGQFVPTSASWRASSSYLPARAILRECLKCCQLFRAFRGRALLGGMVHPYFRWAR